MIDTIRCLGQAGVKIPSSNALIYIDPIQIEEVEKADIICLTHDHDDHCSIDDLQKIIKDETIIVASAKCKDKIASAVSAEIRGVAPGDTVDVKGVVIKAVYAYNIVKTNFHPKDAGNVGFVITVDGTTIYHAGDTERIPEMKDITCDIMLLPLGQTYTMNSVEEAAEAARDVGPKKVIPIHYGLYEGSADDADTLKELLAGQIEVVLKL